MPPQAAQLVALDQLGGRRRRASFVRTRRAGADRDRQILYRFRDIAEEEKRTHRRDLALTPLHFNRVLFRAREAIGSYRQ
jgi:hypothetical protein